MVLVIAGGVLLGNYISQPISELEDGLLAIINGSSDLRFQIEHDELGGLVFRINSLLNAHDGGPRRHDRRAGPLRPGAERRAGLSRRDRGRARLRSASAVLARIAAGAPSHVMGLFDFLSKKKDAQRRRASNKELARLERLVANKLSQNYDRQEAIEELSQDRRRAASARRSCSSASTGSIDPSITDQDEKETVGCAASSRPARTRSSRFASTARRPRA